MDFNKVKVDVESGVATLTLNDPEVMNAISLDVLEGLGEAFDYIEDKANGVRCVVLTGAGKGFCAGANLQGRNTGDSKRGAGSVLESHYHPLLRRMRRLHCPIVTAVNGAAAGAGMSLALMGDLVLAAKVRLFPAGLPAHRSRAGCGLDLHPAAKNRRRARDGTVAARREAAGGEGAAMGPHQPRAMTMPR